MPPTVEEALAVLQEAATTRRSQTALSAFKEAIESADRGPDSKSSSEKPDFPDATSVAEHFGDEQQRQGQLQPATARGTATARKGS